jgi:hypothetical protein
MKKVPLTQGYFALVDDEDYEKVIKYKWFIDNRKFRKTIYARTTIHHKDKSKVKRIAMHRMIMKVTNPKIKVDHRNHNGLDNQKHNLRKATHKENMRNQSPRRNKLSLYKGVSVKQIKSGIRYVATITKNNKRLHIGTFEDEIECALAYNKNAKKLFGKFAYQNKVKVS